MMFFLKELAHVNSRIDWFVGWFLGLNSVAFLLCVAYIALQQCVFLSVNVPCIMLNHILSLWLFVDKLVCYALFIAYQDSFYSR